VATFSSASDKLFIHDLSLPKMFPEFSQEKFEETRQKWQ